VPRSALWVLGRFLSERAEYHPSTITMYAILRGILGLGVVQARWLGLEAGT
jgi:hypothetical protein